MELQLINHGIMLPYYFQGTSGISLYVSIDQKTTIAEMIQELDNNINLFWDHIEYVASICEFPQYLLEPKIEQLIQDLKASNKENLNNFVAPELDFTFDDQNCDDIYPVIIFSIEFID